MVPYNITPYRTIDLDGKKIFSFKRETYGETAVVKSFSAEWKKFSRFTEKEIQSAGKQYFDIVADEMLNKNTTALDIGCGSGRWTRFVADRAGFVEGIDLIDSIHKAAEMNGDKTNVRITQAGIDNIPFADGSFGFIYCLGVLHHLPDTEQSLALAVRKLKPGGYFLLYVYYKLSDAGIVMNVLFALATIVRVVVSRLPDFLKLPVCDLIAFTIYLPFVMLTKTVYFFSPSKKWYRFIPLYYYADKSFRIMRNDSLDRFGTPIEKRFSKEEILNMMEKAGLENIVFSENAPCWHATGRKK